MKSVLHGSWIVDSTGQEEGVFFVWAERTAPAARRVPPIGRIMRHPYAATAIEIADLLASYVPDVDWRSAKRLTRVALLPSTEKAPIVPRWLVEGDALDGGEAALARLTAWRTEGLGLPILEMLEVLVSLPLENHDVAAVQRLGSDLRY